MKNNIEQTSVTKEKLENQISELKAEISESEKSLIRSLASLMEALVNEAPFNRNDVEFFKTLMAMIKLNRERLQIFKDALKNLD